MKHITSLVAGFLFAGALIGFQALAGPGGFAGKVTETMDAGGYTYVLVDTSTNKVWAAATKFQVKPGDLVTVPEAMPMTNFHSQSLNRDFPVIYFAGSIKLNGANAAAWPAGHPPSVVARRAICPPAIRQWRVRRRRSRWISPG